MSCLIRRTRPFVFAGPAFAAFAAFATLAGLAACSSDDDGSGVSEPEIRSGSCAQEIALVCPAGLFDGCQVPGLTTKHVCVAEEDRSGGASCAQEIARVCAQGLKDACLLTPAPSAKHVCVQDGASSPPPSGGRPAPSCAMEIALVCPEGSFDGCLGNVTNAHVCVADEDRSGGSSCALEILKVCEPGFKDACAMQPAPSGKHVCVKQ